MTQHTAAIVIVAVMAAGVMVTVTTAAVAAVKALRDYMKERDKKKETWIGSRSCKGLRKDGQNSFAARWRVSAKKA